MSNDNVCPFELPEGEETVTKELVDGVVIAAATSRRAIRNERDAKTIFLRMLVNLVREGLPCVCSKVTARTGALVPEPPPVYAQGLFLASDGPNDPQLFLSPEGEFFSVWARPNRVCAYTALTDEEVIEARRWDVWRITKSLAEAFEANLRGNLKVISKSESIAARIKVCALFLEDIR